VMMSAFLLISLLIGSPAQAETSAQDFITNYDSASDDGKRWLVGYMTGLVTGFGWSNTTLKVQNQLPLYCMSDEEAVGNTELLKVLRREMRRDKQVGHAPFGMAVLATLMRQFPCGKKTPE
jgi:hypothetical protein